MTDPLVAARMLAASRKLKEQRRLQSGDHDRFLVERLVYFLGNRIGGLDYKPGELSDAELADALRALLVS